MTIVRKRIHFTISMLLCFVIFIPNSYAIDNVSHLRLPLKSLKSTQPDDAGLQLISPLLGEKNSKSTVERELLESMQGTYAIFFDRRTGTFDIKFLQEKKDITNLCVESADIYDINQDIYGLLEAKGKGEIKETRFSKRFIRKIFIGKDKDTASIDPVKLYRSLRFSFTVTKTRHLVDFQEWLLPFMRLMLIESPDTPSEILIEALHDFPFIITSEAAYSRIRDDGVSSMQVDGYDYTYYHETIKVISETAEANILKRAKKNKYSVLYPLLKEFLEISEDTDSNSLGAYYAKIKAILGKMSVRLSDDMALRKKLIEAEKKYMEIRSGSESGYCGEIKASLLGILRYRPTSQYFDMSEENQVIAYTEELIKNFKAEPKASIGLITEILSIEKLPTVKAVRIEQFKKLFMTMLFLKHDFVKEFLACKEPSKYKIIDALISTIDVYSLELNKRTGVVDNEYSIELIDYYRYQTLRKLAQRDKKVEKALKSLIIREIYKSLHRGGYNTLFYDLCFGDLMPNEIIGSMRQVTDRMAKDEKLGYYYWEGDARQKAEEVIDYYEEILSFTMRPSQKAIKTKI